MFQKLETFGNKDAINVKLSFEVQRAISLGYADKQLVEVKCEVHIVNDLLYQSQQIMKIKIRLKEPRINFTPYLFKSYD